MTTETENDSDAVGQHLARMREGGGLAVTIESCSGMKTVQKSRRRSVRKHGEVRRRSVSGVA